MKTFISYSVEDKNDAGNLHRLLSLLGFECFLAHRDIKKGDQWRNVIIKELKRSEVFIPVLSEHGLSSAWVHQECGMAHLLNCGKKKPLIIPLTVSAAPPGCLAIYQALPVSQRFFGLGGIDLSHEVAKRLSLEIAHQTGCLAQIKNSAIESISRVEVADLEYVLAFLVESKHITFDDFLVIIRQASANPHTVHSDKSMKWLYGLLAEYRDRISSQPSWVTIWNGLHNRYQAYKTEERLRVEESLKAISVATKRLKKN